MMRGSALPLPSFLALFLPQHRPAKDFYTKIYDGVALRCERYCCCINSNHQCVMHPLIWPKGHPLALDLSSVWKPSRLLDHEFPVTALS